MTQRIYQRTESGTISTSDAKDWTPRAYLDAHPHLEYAETEILHGWPDSLVDWYAIGGADCGTMAAVGFPVTDEWRFVEQIQYLRKHWDLTPAQQGPWRALSLASLADIVQRLSWATTEAEAILSGSVDADHAALMADSDLGADQDQDWTGERTEWTFQDDSVLVISGPDAWTFQRVEP